MQIHPELFTRFTRSSSVEGRRYFTFIYVICLLLLAILSCKSFSKKEHPNTTSIKNKPSAEMPIPPLPTNLGDYAEDWKIVDSLQNQGLYKSALEKVEAIQARAKNAKNGQQIVKALLFRGKFMTMLEEDGLTNAIQTIEKETLAAGEPEKSVLQSILGQLYSTYLQSQGWNLKQRTPIPDGEGGDILTWSAEQIEKHALELYTASVAQDALLRNIPVEQFRDITMPGQNDSVANIPLRPSLFDLLSHRAVAHFSNERSYLSEPAYAFQLSSADDFADGAVFQNKNYETQDKTSGKWLAIKLFQKLLRAHSQAQGVAYFDVELKRLQFVWNNSTLENKNELYQKALENLKIQAVNHPFDGEVVHAYASHLFNLETGDKGANAKRAVAELEAAISRHPDTYGASICRQLLSQIRMPSLSSNVEQVNLPEKHILVNLGFRNLKKLWVKVVQTDFDQEKWDNLDWNEQYQYLQNLRPVQTRSWEIQDPGDYQEHQTEIALDGLPFGNYWLFISENADFQSSNGPLAYSNFAVSNIAAVHYNEQGATRFVLANRSTGAPLPGVKLDYFSYDYNSGRRKLQNIGSNSSDREGFAKSVIPENRSARVRATLGNDTLWIGQAYNQRVRGNTGRTPQVHFFTDRSIYRPGQLVYFKGLVFKPSNEEKGTGQLPQILSNHTVTVQFYDANRQVKGELKLKSNEFGTFNGTFTAPATGLTGQMSLGASNGATGNTYISVEEYKRPRFEVTVKPVEGAFRVNEKITVRGEAKNYAGNVVDGAEVKYRVVRVARFPFWDYYRYWKRPSYFDSPEMEITNGTTSTGTDGNFSLVFTAIPDAMIPPKDQPVFDYQVFVDVTDITGETQSNTSSVSAGYIALQVQWDLSNEIHLDSLRSVGINTTNMAGQAQAAEGQITLQRLVPPLQFFKDRMWERPDISTLSKRDFDRMFPDMAWKDEDDPAKWGREDFTRSIPFNTAKDKTLDLHQGRSQPGWYVAKLTTKDAFGEKVEIEKYVRVWSSETRFEKPSAAAEKITLQPGETGQITFGGKPEGLYFFFAQEQAGAMLKPEWVSSHMRGLSKVEIPIREENRGGIVTHIFCIKNNRIYGPQQIYLNVPWSNKELKITYESFRDKLAPGQKEELRIKISGPQKDKVAAEMVAAMYDASLDQFRPHQWSGIAFPSNYTKIFLSIPENFGTNSGQTRFENPDTGNTPTRSYRELNWFDFPMWGGRSPFRGNVLRAKSMMRDGEVEYMSAAPAGGMEEVAVAGGRVDGNEYYVDGIRVSGGEPPVADIENAPTPAAPPTPIRRNLNETVFFFPEMRTDAEGNVILKFTMNEALTRWKLLTFAHTKDLQQVLSVKEVVTQKDLMVIANPPRFLRQGDEIEFSAKVSNLSKEKIEGTASLSLLDAATLAVVEKAFGMTTNNHAVSFSAPPGQSSSVSWRIKVPEDYSGALTWQIFADGKGFRDGEESTIPVVSNRMLVTETLPISLRGGQTKTFTFENLKNAPTSGNNASLSTHKYTLEFTSNPVWYAVQSLPYLMEFPHECSEQIFSRLYANTLASNVVEKMPNIKRVFERWKGGEAMKSNLSKNQELKYALLEETPWVLEAQSEEMQKQNIALLFDLNRMANERERALNTLAERQLDSGGWPWFTGGKDSWYITQHIVSGFMHLQKLGAFDPQKDQKSDQMIDKALGYCDRKLNDQYAELEKLVQQGKAKWEDDHLDGMAIQYLYVRSFRPVDRPGKEIGYYLGQAEKYWLGKGLYQEGMLALALHRYGRNEGAGKIVASFRERATQKEELGMYWPVDWGFYWYQLPIETQALMVEVFSEVANDAKAVEELRIWLLKNKQTNRWESTKATAEAVYALLLNGENWLNNTQPVKISMGGVPLKVNEYEAGTGYFKQSWAGNEVKKSWSEIKVENPNTNIVWGAAYWQYFEDLDKIKDFQKTPLTIVKQLFLEENSPTGQVLKPIADGQKLKRGDKVKVRIEIRVDRAMEFVHLKDMRASGLEPTNVLSGYRWQGGLGYYESTKDLATHFFIDYLPRGTFVFEYPLVVSLRGDMSNGITTMQCMYAPEFTSHSKGVRVKVE
ncbi:MAG: alpha-2-macroglobulin family protein [Saprospiraceae bacterium]